MAIQSNATTEIHRLSIRTSLNSTEVVLGARDAHTDLVLGLSGTLVVVDILLISRKGAHIVVDFGHFLARWNKVLVAQEGLACPRFLCTNLFPNPRSHVIYIARESSLRATGVLLAWESLQ